MEALLVVAGADRASTPAWALLRPPLWLDPGTLR